MTFHVGQKVVCVDDANIKVPRASKIVRKGERYFITFIAPTGNLGIEGHPNPYPLEGDIGWMPRRFRPIVEKKTETGMAVLREILDRESFTERKLVKATGVE